MALTIFNLRILKTLDNLAFPTQQARETGAPWTDSSVFKSYYLLLKLDKLGFQPSKQGRQELPGLILQSLIVLLLTIKIRDTGIPTQQARETGAPWTDTSVFNTYYLLLKLETLGFQPSKQGRQELPGLLLQSMILLLLTIEIRQTGIPTQQARETGAPWTDTSVFNSYYLLLKLDKLGFQPSKQARQELPGLILQSLIVLLLTIKIRDTGIPTQQARETGAPWTDTSVFNTYYLLLKLETLGFQPSKQGRQELPGLLLQSMILLLLTIEIRQTGIPTQQARETGAPWTDTSVFNSYYLLLKLDKLGFQPSKQARQELPGLILQSIIVLLLTIKIR